MAALDRMVTSTIKIPVQKHLDKNNDEIYPFKLYVDHMCSLLFCTSSLKIAIAGLSHGHVDWIFNRQDKNDIELVGIYETNPELIDRYAKRYNMDKKLFFTNLEEMLDKLKPQ